MEGIDGVGKTTQINLLEKYLNDTEQSCNVIRQPLMTPLGTLIRQYLKEDQTKGRDPIKMALMFAANRVEMDEVITKCEQDGIRYILHDRSYLSNLAYSNLDPTWFYLMEKYSPKPDILIYLDMDVQEAYARSDKMEYYENLGFLKSVKQRYQEAIKEWKDERSPERLVHLKIKNEPPEVVHEMIVKELRRTLHFFK